MRARETSESMHFCLVYCITRSCWAAFNFDWGWRGCICVVQTAEEGCVEWGATGDPDTNISSMHSIRKNRDTFDRDWSFLPGICTQLKVQHVVLKFLGQLEMPSWGTYDIYLQQTIVVTVMRIQFGSCPLAEYCNRLCHTYYNSHIRLHQHYEHST